MVGVDVERADYQATATDHGRFHFRQQHVFTAQLKRVGIRFYSPCTVLYVANKKLEHFSRRR